MILCLSLLIYWCFRVMIPRNVKHIGSGARCRAESPSSPHSFLNLCSRSVPSPPPTHAHPRRRTSTCNLELHFLLSLSLSPLSVSHMHTCACTPRTRFPFELSWQLSPAPLSSPSSSPSPFSPSLCNSNEEPATVSTAARTCAALQRALRHHLRVTDEIAFNRWLGR